MKIWGVTQAGRKGLSYEQDIVGFDSPTPYLTLFYSKKSRLMSKTLEVLNSAFAVDPNAILCLCINSVPCNQALADHPEVVVQQAATVDGLHLNTLGLLNGILVANGQPMVQFLLLSTKHQS